MKKKIAFLLSLAFALSSCCVPAMAIKNVTQYEPEDVLSKEQIEREQISDWAKEEIDAARAMNLLPTFTGNPAYQDTITREQFAELIVQTVEAAQNQKLEAASTAFADSSNPSVLKASQAGIVNGVGENKFAPNVTTNREEIATMIARAVKYIEQKSGVSLAPKAASIAGFADQAQVSSWAVEGVGLLAANGIMNGTSATTLSPKESCTVEQSILLCYRLYVKFLEA